MDSLHATYNISFYIEFIWSVYVVNGKSIGEGRGGVRSGPFFAAPPLPDFEHDFENDF